MLIRKNCKELVFTLPHCLERRAFEHTTRSSVQFSEIKVSRFLVITWLAGPLGWLAGGPCVQAYKLAETPINITNSNDSTVVREAAVVQNFGESMSHSFILTT